MARTTRTRKRKASVELSREPPDSRAIPLVKTPDEETSTSRSSLLSLPRELRDKIFYYAVLPPNFILIGDDDLLPRYRSSMRYNLVVAAIDLLKKPANGYLSQNTRTRSA